MTYYIDQSGKIEFTKEDTVLAYSNGKQKSIIIKASIKRKIQKMFREAGKPEIYIYKTFSALIFLLIKDDLKNIKQLIIDREYKGKENLIKSYLTQILLKKYIKEKIPNIYFAEIGRDIDCHIRALAVKRGKCKVDLAVTLKEITDFLI